MGFVSLVGAAGAAAAPVTETITGTAATIALEDNTQYVCTSDSLTALVVTVPEEDETGFMAGVTFTYSSGMNVGFTGADIYFIGTDCYDGDFVPQEDGYKYDIVIWYNGLCWKAAVG